MAPYPSNGSLTTDKRTVDDTTTWDGQSDWEAYQAANNVEIVNGAVQLEERAIPDPSDLHAHYDATELSLTDQDSVSTWPDETGNGHDLTAGTAPTFIGSSINGNPVVRFDGSDDILTVAFSAVPQPVSIFAVLQWQTAGGVGNQYAWSSETGTQFRLQDNDPGEIMFAGTILDSETIDTDPHVYGTLYNTTNSSFREDGVEAASGAVGSNDLEGFAVGNEPETGNNANIDFGEILIYPQDKSGIASDVEAYLSDKWGITV